jgi:hypothetical protein
MSPASYRAAPPRVACLDKASPTRPPTANQSRSTSPEPATPLRPHPDADSTPRHRPRPDAGSTPRHRPRPDAGSTYPDANSAQTKMGHPCDPRPPVAVLSELLAFRPDFQALDDPYTLRSWKLAPPIGGTGRQDLEIRRRAPRKPRTRPGVWRSDVRPRSRTRRQRRHGARGVRPTKRRTAAAQGRTGGAYGSRTNPYGRRVRPSWTPHRPYVPNALRRPRPATPSATGW